MTSKHDYIKEAAYFIWLNRGKPEGQDLEIWDEATKIYELTQEVLKPVAKKTAPAKKVVAKKSIKVAVKPVAKKAVKKVAPKKAEVKPTAKTVQIAKIIPMVKKETPAKKATAPKTKIKIVVGRKK